MAKVFVQLISRERDNVVRLILFVFAALGMNTELAVFAVLQHELGEELLSDFIELPSLDCRMTKIKAVGELHF